MTTIDILSVRAIAKAAGLGEILDVYFDRVEGVVGGWKCKSCGSVFADRVAYSPPPPHDCTMLCANCDNEAGILQKGSHGICPRHFVSEWLKATG